MRAAISTTLPGDAAKDLLSGWLMHLPPELPAPEIGGATLAYLKPDMQNRAGENPAGI